MVNDLSRIRIRNHKKPFLTEKVFFGFKKYKGSVFQEKYVKNDLINESPAEKKPCFPQPINQLQFQPPCNRILNN